jgi:AraC-like DNA-binding protein
MKDIAIFAPSAANLWQVIESYGLDPAPFFLEEEIRLTFPIDPSVHITYPRIDRIRTRAAEVTGDEAFGLRSASSLHPSHLGSLGYAWLASTSMRTAFERLHRFIRIINRYSVTTLVENGDRLQARLVVQLESHNRWLRDDSIVAILTAMCRFNLGPDFKPLEVGFRHDPPQDPAPYEALFGCELRFGLDYNLVTISTADADRVLSSGNPQLARLNDQVMIRYLAQTDRQDIVSQTRVEIIDQLSSGNLGIEKVAQALFLTPRTLRRRLSAESTSFKQLLTEVRRELATQYIHDPTLTLTEISFMLGFSEASSFSRAFRNWTGQAPGEMRP